MTLFLFFFCVISITSAVSHLGLCSGRMASKYWNNLSSTEVSVLCSIGWVPCVQLAFYNLYRRLYNVITSFTFLQHYTNSIKKVMRNYFLYFIHQVLGFHRTNLSMCYLFICGCVLCGVQFYHHTPSGLYQHNNRFVKCNSGFFHFSSLKTKSR